MALFRALETVRAPRRRRFADPLAREFLGGRFRLAVRIARLPGVAELLCRFVDRRWPGARTSAVARTRFIDERFASALAGGVRQVVLLGAGFDARAWRLVDRADCVVFEVDHPATQARKRAILAASGVRAPEGLRFVPTDFAVEKVATTIAAAGYDRARRSLLVWEGVTNYLTGSAVDETLRWCAQAAPGSELIFTYVHRRVLDDPAPFFGTAGVFERLAAAGERWTFGLDPAELDAYLRERGLALVEDVGASDYRAACYGPESAAMRGYEFYRIARARVP